MARIAACRLSVVGDVGTDRDRLVAGEMNGFLAGPGIDLGNGDFGAFAGE
jgi:hypothetical protein